MMPTRSLMKSCFKIHVITTMYMLVYICILAPTLQGWMTTLPKQLEGWISSHDPAKQLQKLTNIHNPCLHQAGQAPVLKFKESYFSGAARDIASNHQKTSLYFKLKLNLRIKVLTVPTQMQYMMHKFLTHILNFMCLRSQLAEECTGAQTF